MAERNTKILRMSALAAFGLSGAAALIYEVTWTRALAVILGSTTYALSTMLATFMAGLALGAALGGRVTDRARNLVVLFGLLEIGIGACGLVAVPLIHGIQPLYFTLYRAFHISPSAYFFAQFLLCAAIMLVPTTLMGATFPIVSRIATGSYEEMGRGVGNAYSFNTAGAIAGSLAAGFLLIPALGVRFSSVTAAALNLAVGAFMLFASRAKVSRVLLLLVASVIAAAGALAMISKEQEWPITFYLAERYENYEQFLKETAGSVVLSDREYREGRVRLWRDKNGFLVLQVGGKVEGTAREDIANTILLAYLPIAHHRDPRSFLTIGLGTGITLAAAKEQVKDVSLVEINEGVVTALREHGPADLFAGIDITVNDARNHLLTTGERFDIISSEPSYPTESSVGGLLTREFYEIAASRLKPGGIFCQWLPYFLLSNEDVTMMLKTFGGVFEHVTLWKVIDSMDLIMVGSREPFPYSPGEVAGRVRRMNARMGFLHYTLSRSPAEVGEIVRTEVSVPLNTDDRPLLEFHAARNLLVGVQD